jgi:hypothetical protein
VRDRLLAELTNLGVEAKVDNDGDLEFVLRDPENGTTTTLFARVAEGDLPLVRFFGQWQLQDPPVTGDQLARLARCNDFTLQLNLVKVTLVQESLVVSAEHVITPNADLNILTTLSINHILQAVQFFFESWQSVDPEQTGQAGEVGPLGQRSLPSDGQ